MSVGSAAEPTVTAAVAVFDGSAMEVAVMVTLPGAMAGAKYSPAAVQDTAEFGQMYPTVAFPPAILFTDQLTAVLDVPVTVAVNW